MGWQQGRPRNFAFRQGVVLLVPAKEMTHAAV